MESIMGGLLIVGGMFGIVFFLLYLFYGPSLWDKTYCMDCHIKMKETGYIAHGFQRAYRCPLCNILVYIVDKTLRAQRLREIEKGDI